MIINKKASFFVLSLISATIFGSSVESLTSQLAHVQTQIKTVKLSSQRSELTLQEAKKLNPTLFSQIESNAKNILTQKLIVAKINALVREQAKDIVNNNKPYVAINFLESTFPELLKEMTPYLKLVIIHIANKYFRLLLEKNLTSQANKLAAALARETTEETSTE